MPSRGFLEAVAFTSTVVSPYRTRTEPPARQHILPVSKLIFLPANSVSYTWKFSNIV